MMFVFDRFYQLWRSCLTGKVEVVDDGVRVALQMFDACEVS